MKRVFILMAVLGLGLSVSCHMPTSLAKPGSLVIKLPKAPVGRTVTANDGIGDTFRFQLAQGQTILPWPGAGGAVYYQVTYTPSGQVTVDNIPPGSGYVLIVSSGQAGPSGYFETAYFGGSGAPFTISSGAVTSVTVSLDTAPAVLLEDQASGPHAAVGMTDGSGLFFMNGQTIEGIPSNSLPTLSSAWTPAYPVPTLSPTPVPFSTIVSGGGQTLNSLGIDHVAGSGPTLVFNTNLGSYGVTGTNVNTAVTGSTILSGGAAGAVTSSGSVEVYITPASGNVTSPLGTSGLAYQIGPVYSGFQVTQGSWVSVPGLAGVAATVDSTFYDTNNYQDTAISNFLYLAVAGSVYRMPGAYVNSDYMSTFPFNQTTDSNGNPLAVPNSGGAFVNQVSDITDNTANAYVFEATNSGVYAGPVNYQTGIYSTGTASLPLVSGTGGLNFTTIATSSITNVNNAQSLPWTCYTAAYSPTNQTVYVFGNNTLINEYPTIIGLPAGTLSLAWTKYSAVGSVILYLVVTGADATVVIPVTTWTLLT